MVLVILLGLIGCAVSAADAQTPVADACKATKTVAESAAKGDVPLLAAVEPVGVALLAVPIGHRAFVDASVSIAHEGLTGPLVPRAPPAA